MENFEFFFCGLELFNGKLGKRTVIFQWKTVGSLENHWKNEIVQWKIGGNSMDNWDFSMENGGKIGCVNGKFGEHWVCQWKNVEKCDISNGKVMGKWRAEPT